LYPVIETEILYSPVLNVENPTGEALAFRTALLEQRINLDYVGGDGLWFGGRFERRVYPIFKVVDVTGGQESHLNSSYVGEKFSGSVHPLVLVSAEDARDCLNGK
jgi:hypothetical protein